VRLVTTHPKQEPHRVDYISLIARGHEIHFASGQSCRKRIDQFNAQLSNFEDTAGKTVIFHDLGPEDCINDHNYMASASPEAFAGYKRILAQGPRNVSAFNELVDLVMQGSLEGRKDVMDRFIDLMKEIKPDILVLDQFASCFVDAARVTGVDYIVTAPASPSTLSCESIPSSYFQIC
jgi:UDP:flavonoid glycosyltransferase YjiC (YdhE family)